MITWDIDPTTIDFWDNELAKWDDANVFHESCWAHVLKSTYGYRCFYTMSDQGDLMIPMIEVDSRITGRRGISVPFSDFCQPLVQNIQQMKAYFNGIQKIAIEKKWKYIEWRGDINFFKSMPAFNVYYCHELEIDKEPSDILRSFRKGTKSAIKKAERDGLVSIDISTSLEALKDYYFLHCLTRKRLGVPPQPFKFFLKIYEFIISKGKGVIISANCNNKNVASGIFLHHNKHVIYKFGASRPGFHKLRPTNLLLWHAILFYSNKNCKYFNFGRTDINNKGLLTFKRGWGTNETLLKYYRYDLNKKEFEQKSKESSGKFNFSKVFKRLPMPVLKLIGALFYKHIA